MTQHDWDDERLAAAFHARFDRPAPPTLARAIHAAIAGTHPARPRLFRRGPLWGLAAAAVVVVLVTTITAGLGGFGRLGGGPTLPSDSGASSSPGANATPTEQALPGSVLGLQVITVSDAIAIRDAGSDDRELAVMGWFTPAPTISCRESPASYASPIQLQCPDHFIWLTERAESLIHQAGNPLTTAPVGPALNPDLDDLDHSWQRLDLGIGANGDSTPTDVVFIGHFDDRRAALCPEAERAVCRDRFVVDSAALVAGYAPPRSLVRSEGVNPVSTLTDIESILTLEAPQSTILSIAVVGGSGGLVASEPSLRNGREGLMQQPIVWVARVLETDRISTYIIVDGTDAIYEMNPEGEAILVGGTPPPASSVGPWPPAGAIVIALTSEVVAGAPPARVAVVDLSGRLTGVSEKGAVDPATQSFVDWAAAYAEPGKPGRVHLTWTGGICDSQITVTVDKDVGSITFDMGPRVDCDTVAIGRELVLDFSGSVNVPAIEVLDSAATPTPVQRDYALDCGPLGPDTCETSAAQIVAANLRANPPQRVVSIRFTTPCGSFEVIFADGTGAGAEVDCTVPPSPG